MGIDYLLSHGTPVTSTQLQENLAVARWSVIMLWRHIYVVLPNGPATEPRPDDLVHVLEIQRIAATLAFGSGNLPAMHAWLTMHDRWLTWSGIILGRSEGHILWAQYFRAGKKIKESYEHIERALRFASDLRQIHDLIAAYRLLGELHTETGRFVEATEAFGTALDFAQKLEGSYERAMILIALGELQLLRGRRQEGEKLLDEARAIYTRLHVAGVITAAAGPAPDREAPLTVSSYPAGLSKREAEVLTLLATGKSNRDIAEMLHISVWTVSRHIAHILAKTESKNRTAAAAFARLHNLV